MKRALLPLLVLPALVASGLAAAQEYHYWTNSYGTRGQLLGGVVVGSVSDLSSTFYNPGAIVKTPDANLIISTSAYQLESLSFQDESSDTAGIQSVDLGVAPSIFALRVTRKTAPHQFVISGLTRYSDTFRDWVSVIDERDVISSNPGDEYYTGRLDVESRLWEGWGGFSWSHALGNRVGIGITQYLAYREQHTRFATSAEAVAPGGAEGTSEEIVKKYDYFHARILWKLGAFFDYPHFDFGFAVTTPSITLFSGGSSYYEHSIINSGGTPPNKLASSYQQNPDISYRSPFSIAGGASCLFGRTKLHATLEWFAGIGEYPVVDPGSFEAQVDGGTVSYSHNTEIKPVLNAGVGLEHKFSKLLSVYGSFITDFTAWGGSSVSPTEIFGWNRYHVTGGSSFAVKNFHLTVGLGYGFGNASFQRTVELEDGVFSNPFGTASDGKAKYRRFLLLFGFSLGT